jgi:hypothetical protein
MVFRNRLRTARWSLSRGEMVLWGLVAAARARLGAAAQGGSGRDWSLFAAAGVARSMAR